MPSAHSYLIRMRQLKNVESLAGAQIGGSARGYSARSRRCITAGRLLPSVAAGLLCPGKPTAQLRTMRDLRDQLSLGEAERFGVGPAVVLGQDLAHRAGPVGHSAVADLAAGNRQMGDSHRKAAGTWFAHHLYDASSPGMPRPYATCTLRGR
jgi:hypothetical protein